MDVEMGGLYDGGTATDTNWVYLIMADEGTQGWFHHHFVNFNIPGGINFRETFTVFFAQITEMTFYAGTRFVPPPGQNYKILSL